ncbi:hypothetical protein PENANT_c007G01665 [Penicillium antarcticum]|uniref:Uncharacterized protein n=1 Tax=Penicillium antarcticum TaxID=416450 RepID=A0A1V6QBR2_9EURO|nr:hypothetical protein PENANT_c007G01665 [Penicillium antarcticum]
MPQVVRLAQSHQISAIRLLAESLYEATRATAASSNQAHNELALLLTVLNTTETYSSLSETGCPHMPVLAKRLQSCHDILVDLQKLHLHPDALGAQSQINEIRANLSSLIFGLSEINTNMMISSQKSINKSLTRLIDANSTEAQELSALSDHLDEDVSKAEADQVWAQLQHCLDTAGVRPEMSTQNREYIISSLKKMRKSEKRSAIDTAAAPADISTSSPKALSLIHKRSLDDTNDSLENQPNGPPIVPSPSREPKPPRRKPLASCLGLSKIPVVIEENLPIPVVFEVQDSAGIRNQPLPHEDFPIPAWTESTIESVISSREHTSQTDSSIPSTPSIPTTHETNPTTLEPTLHALKVVQSKKPNRMSRIMFQMTNSKQKLITAIQKGDLETLTTLLTKGADAKTTNHEGQTPLMAAASYGHENIVRLLIEFGADMDAQAHDGETALTTAAGRGFERIIRILIASGAKTNSKMGARTKTPLSQAAAFGQDRIVKLLLDCGADINALNNTGHTALGVAALNGNMRVARVLLDRGANVDKSGSTWQSPLLEAIRQNHAEMVVLLMERRANPPSPFREVYGYPTFLHYEVAKKVDEVDDATDKTNNEAYED